MCTGMDPKTARLRRQKVTLDETKLVDMDSMCWPENLGVALSPSWLGQLTETQNNSGPPPLRL